MNKFKIIKINISIFALIMAASLLFISNKAYAVIGQHYNSMVTQYGAPKSLALNKAISSKDLQNYQTKGIAVSSLSSWTFQINGFKMIALFNASNVCYEMKTYSNRTLPNPKDLIGSLANTKPILIHRSFLISAEYQYGTGANAIIYRTFGLPGDLSAVAYSPSLKP